MPRTDRGHSGYQPRIVSVERPQGPVPGPHAPTPTALTKEQPVQTEPQGAPLPSDAAPATPEAAPRVQLEPAPGQVVPQLGFKAWLYRRNRKRNTPDKKNPQYLRVPKLGRKEQKQYEEFLAQFAQDWDEAHAENEAWETARFNRELEAQARANAVARQKRLDDYQADLIDRLRFLAALGISPVISFCNIKSGTKTTNALGIGNVIAQYTRKNVLLLPTTANTATGTAALMTGLSGNILRVSEYARNLKELGVPRTLGQRTPRTKWGLMVISEDLNSAANEDDAPKTKQFMDMVDTTLPNVDVLLLDHGNDNISKWSIALQGVRLSHVLNFPFMVDSPVTHEMIRSTVAGCNTDTGIPEDVMRELYTPFQNKDHSGWNVSTLEKVRKSVFLATKTKPRQHVDFDFFTTPQNQSANAPAVPAWDGSAICVPEDPSINRIGPDNKLLPFDLDLLEQVTHIAYLEAAVANFQTTAPLQGINLAEHGYVSLRFRGESPALPSATNPSTQISADAET